DRGARDQAAQPLLPGQGPAGCRRQDAAPPGRIGGAAGGSLGRARVISFADGGLVAGRWANFENLACLAVAGSSNDLAREVIELYFDEDQNLPMTVILAEAQLSARGRKGQWRAPAGRGLYLTFVRPARHEEPLTLIPLAVARWVRDAIEDSTRVSARL